MNIVQPKNCGFWFETDYGPMPAFHLGVHLATKQLCRLPYTDAIPLGFARITYMRDLRGYGYRKRISEAKDTFWIKCYGLTRWWCIEQRIDLARLIDAVAAKTEQPQSDHSR